MQPLTYGAVHLQAGASTGYGGARMTPLNTEAVPAVTQQVSPLLAVAGRSISRYRGCFGNGRYKV